MPNKSNGRKEDLVLVLRTGAKHLAFGVDPKAGVFSIAPGKCCDQILLMGWAQFEDLYGRKAPHIGQRIVFWERVTQSSPMGDDNEH